MSKKKGDKFVYKKRQLPHIIEVLDQKLLRDYIWRHNGRGGYPVKVWRYVGLGILNEGDEPKAYWYIVEQTYDDDPDIPSVRQYGFFRRQQWDR